MQRHLAPRPQGKPAKEPNEDQRRQENLGFHSGVTRGASATQKKRKKEKKKQGRFDGNGADERPRS